MRRPHAPTRPLDAALVSLAAALAALPLSAGPLGAHGDAVLELGSSSAAAGSEITVDGSSFETGSDYTLRLVGALDEHDVAEVRPDAEGTFSLSLRIPDGVDEGRWELVAVAPDGDVVARTPLTVVASAAAGAGGGDGAGAAGEGASSNDGGGDGARAGDIRVERDRSGAEWAVIGLLVGLAGSVGVGLLRG